jgi:DNA-binding HxlR family transcriptional regulator
MNPGSNIGALGDGRGNDGWGEDFCSMLSSLDHIRTRTSIIILSALHIALVVTRTSEVQRSISGPSEPELDR